MLENKYQARLIKKLKAEYPDAIIVPNNGNYIQGFPDVTMFCGKKYVMLECKKGEKEKHQPNQDYYISKFNKMSFGEFVYPENEEEVLGRVRKFIGGKHGVQ